MAANWEEAEQHLPSSDVESIADEKFTGSCFTEATTTHGDERKARGLSEFFSHAFVMNTVDSGQSFYPLSTTKRRYAHAGRRAASRSASQFKPPHLQTFVFVFYSGTVFRLRAWNTTASASSTSCRVERAIILKRHLWNTFATQLVYCNVQHPTQPLN